MPIFEYRCRDCGAEFEKIVRSDADPVVCEKCRSRRLERLLSVFAVSGPQAVTESGPCPCGAPRRGMCGE
ncbi:MAG TPA: zinc ribbon domain-containing protein [Terriglobia bacterium]|nr:zinc ribbon domain-containing protein [Terriglobia bacterium]